MQWKRHVKRTEIFTDMQMITKCMVTKKRNNPNPTQSSAPAQKLTENARDNLNFCQFQTTLFSNFHRLHSLKFSQSSQIKVVNVLLCSYRSPGLLSLSSAECQMQRALITLKQDCHHGNTPERTARGMG